MGEQIPATSVESWLCQVHGNRDPRHHRQDRGCPHPGGEHSTRARPSRPDDPTAVCRGKGRGDHQEPECKVVREKFEWLNKVYYGTPSLWSRGYFVSTIGMNEEMIRRYVKYQQRQDSGQAKLEF